MKPTSLPGLSTRTEDGHLIVQGADGREYRLERIAAVTFELCDGQRTVEEIVALVSQELGYAVPRETVFLALDGLADAGLLTARVTPPGGSLSRRRLLRGMTAGFAALTLGAASGGLPDALAGDNSGEGHRKELKEKKEDRKEQDKKDKLEDKEQKQKVKDDHEQRRKGPGGEEQAKEEESKEQSEKEAGNKENEAKQSEQKTKEEKAKEQSEQRSKQDTEEQAKQQAEQRQKEESAKQGEQQQKEEAMKAG